MCSSRRCLILAVLAANLSVALVGRAADKLADGFAQPPAQTRPWCYWYWISDQISREGITRDLEAMKRAGIGEALIGNIFLDNQTAGKIKVLSEEWWQLVEHAVREGGRLGVDIGLFNCPGWSQSGGPWIGADRTMRFLKSAEVRVTGPIRLSERLPVPAEPFQDVAVLAFPAPALDGDRLSAQAVRVTVTPALAEKSAAARLVDGDSQTQVRLPVAAPGSDKPVDIDLELPAPRLVRSLQITPTAGAFGADVELLARDSDGKFHTVRRFRADRSNPNLNTGFWHQGPITVSFPAIRSSAFRLRFTRFFGRGQDFSLSEIDLSGAARLDSFVEKQLGDMYPTPLPLADAYTWPAATEPEAANLTVQVDSVRELSAQMASDGTLTWEVPAGEWIIQRVGMTPTGMKNAPASPEGKGYEVDKMNRRLVQQHFEAFVGELLRRMPAGDRRALKQVVADSYEMGSQNWTDDMAPEFKRTYGYDPKPWLPVLSGRVVGSAAQSDRFLWDLRRLVADRVAHDYVGGLREAAQRQGLGLWLENYGHWGFPGEFLSYGGQSDRVGGEFWVTGDLGSIECRAASSAANTYGQPFVSAESFTGGPPFQNAPRDLKARGDWSFTEGVNHVVLHVVIHQPNEDKVPGINAPWGTEFNRHNTWFENINAWVDYERRCCWMLQQGWRVADVAYFIGEDTPKMTGARIPALPPGYDFDFLNAEVLEQRLSVRNGLLVLPHGVSYRVLVLPPSATMRPAVLRKLRDLVSAGATVLGLPPASSPSLQDFPKSDEEVRAIATELWGATTVPERGRHQLGQGQVYWGQTLEEIFASAKTAPDVAYQNMEPDARFLHTHRRSSDADIYFISNQLNRAEKVTVAFRTTGRKPELWDAVTGTRRELPEWREEGGQTLVPMKFAETQSCFVVFREPGRPASSHAQNFTELKPLLKVPGPWTVSFDSRWGPSGSREMPLVDWSQQSDPEVRFFSGHATYRAGFDLPTSIAAGAGPVWLDLGAVHDLAVVKLNGKTAGTVWTAPWRVDISQALRSGANELEITVVNAWNNRLVGDSQLPVQKRRTSLSLNTIKSGSPLRPAGLLGPVTLLGADRGAPEVPTAPAR